MLSRIGTKSFPFFVREYSVRGGISAKIAFFTTPHSSRRTNRSESVRGLIPPTFSCNSENRDVCSVSARTKRGVHLSLNIDTVASTHCDLICLLVFILLLDNTEYSHYTIYSWYTL